MTIGKSLSSNISYTGLTHSLHPNRHLLYQQTGDSANRGRLRFVERGQNAYWTNAYWTNAPPDICSPLMWCTRTFASPSPPNPPLTGRHTDTDKWAPNRTNDHKPNTNVRREFSFGVMSVLLWHVTIVHLKGGHCSRLLSVRDHCSHKGMSTALHTV